MTETKKKPMGSGVTGLVFSIVGLIFALLYPFYLTSEFDAEFGEAFKALGDGYVIIIISLVMFIVTFFIHGSTAGKVTFSIGGFLPIIYILIGIEDNLNSVEEFIDSSEEYFITYGIFQIFANVLPFIIAILLICGITVRCRGTAGFTAPIYVLAGIITFFFFIYFACMLSYFDEYNAPDSIVTANALGELSRLAAIMPYWVTAVMLPPYIRRKTGAPTFGYNPYAYVQPTAPYMPYNQAPVAPPAAPYAPVPTAVYPNPVVPAPAPETIETADSDATEVLSQPEPIADAAPEVFEAADSGVAEIFSQSKPATELSPSEAIAKAKALFDAGLITEEQFNAKRDEIISRI